MKPEPSCVPGAGSPQAERFLACIRAYGASPGRWPPDDRPLFDACADAPWAQAALAAAQELDQWLGAAEMGLGAGRETERGAQSPAACAEKTLQAAFAARAPVSLAAGRPSVRRSGWAGVALGLGMVISSAGGFVWGFNQSVQAAAMGRAQAQSGVAEGSTLAELDPLVARWAAAFQASRAEPVGPLVP
jgi:hypothetical protein